MAGRQFKFRLSARYHSAENQIADMRYENWTRDGWQSYDPENYTAGFLILLYAVLNCQHNFFRNKAAERGLQIERAEGRLEADTGEEWNLTRLHIHIDGTLASGKPTPDDIDYIVDRMMGCPVSVNVAPIPDLKTTIGFK